MVRTERQILLTCPGDLDRPLPPASATAPAGAVIRHNKEGGDWLDAIIARGQAAAAIIADTQRACRDLPIHG